MHHKLKNTLAGLLVAFGMIALSATAGHSPRQAIASADAVDTLVVFEAALPAPASIRKNAPSRSAQMYMPYFSFAPFLPKQEG